MQILLGPHTYIMLDPHCRSAGKKVVVNYTAKFELRHTAKAGRTLDVAATPGAWKRESMQLTSVGSRVACMPMMDSFLDSGKVTRASAGAH